MFKNYLRTALRNFWRNKTFSFINTLGMALGMAFCLLILLWVQDEKSVDAFHANTKQLYTVYERKAFDNKIEGGYSTPGLLAEQVKKDIPEIAYASGFGWNSFTTTFSVGEKIQKETGNYAGADFFTMFSYPLLQGSSSKALSSPLNIALSKKMALDFFGSPVAAIGQTIRFENKKDFTVAAVFDNLPSAASDKFDYIINWQAFLEEYRWAKEWGNNAPKTFLMLRKDANPALVEKKLRHFMDKFSEAQPTGFKLELGLQRFDEKYLSSNFKNGEIDGGRIEYVRLFSLTAFFILLIACINFMNLTTARSVKRAKEIGIRKVAGALRSSLMRQFIGEAILLCFFAVIIALILTILLLPVFNTLTGKQILFPYKNYQFWLGITSLTVITGFVAGSYPALLLSSFNPVKILKGSVKFSSGALWFRKGLVVFQFVLSIVLIIGTIIVSKQVNYIQTKNLGYNKENLLYIPIEGEFAVKYDVFKQTALSSGNIDAVTHIDETPTLIERGTGGVDWIGKAPNTKPQFTPEDIGYDFVKTLQLKMVEGRDFSTDYPTDSLGYMLNETAVKKIGYTDPIGKPITLWGKKGTIIGVIKDFHFNSMHEPVKPLIIRLREKKQDGIILVRTKAGKTKQALASLETICKKLNPAFPFTYKFADLEYAKLYKSEQMVGGLSRYFSFLAIFISCLGLLGLVMFTAEQRTKEFGIRKVLGASVDSLFSLLSKEFLVLVLIATVIAFPIAWFAMNKWLQDFVYRTDISWWIFIVAGIAALLIALITVSFQALKAAMTNPVKSLRTE